MSIKRLNDLATTKAYLQVDDVDLIRANTENTWPVTARYATDVSLSKGNVLLDIGSSANITMSMSYHFDIGPNVFWLSRDLNGQVNQLDFVRNPTPANTTISTTTWGAGSFTANVEVTQPDSNIDIFSVNVYSNSNLISNTGTIRKTSGRNQDVIFYNPLRGNQAQSEFRFKVPYSCNVSVLCIGGGGGGGGYGLSAAGGGGALVYLNDIPLRANDNVYVYVGLGGSVGRTTSLLGARGNTGGTSQFTVVRNGTTVVNIGAGGGQGGSDQDDAVRHTGFSSGYSYDYIDIWPNANGSGGVPLNGTLTITTGTYGGFNGGSSGRICMYNYITGQYSRNNGGGAAGYANDGTTTIGGTSNWDDPEDASTLRNTFNTNPAGNFLSNVGGGAGGVARASSVFDQTAYGGYGTGIYGWNGHKARAEWVANPGTYPNYNSLDEAKYYGGYGATLAGNMDTVFKTTTPNFGAGDIGVGSGGASGVVRIMFDGDKRKFPNTNCGLEVQTASYVFYRHTLSLSSYNGTIDDPDYEKANVFSPLWEFQVVS